MNRNWKKVACLIFLAALLPAVALGAISVSISPASVQVQPGGQVQINATVSGTTNNVVVFSLSGVGCSGNACGHITSNGLYLAPAVAPNPNVVTVTATSLADLTKSAQSAVIIGTSSDVVVSVSPTSARVVVGQQQRFTATVTGTTITGVHWSLSGAGCGDGCGNITSDGLYIAPLTVPNPAQVTVTATSIADPLKSKSATVTVAPPVAVSVSPKTAQVVTGTHQQFIATVTGSSNTSVTWNVAGAGCSGTACGTITTSGLYTAPGSIPSPAQVTITATSVADPTKSSSATATIIPPVVVTVSPKTVQVVAGGHRQFSATVTGTSNLSVTWSLSGVGCSGTACGTITTSGLYTAPSTVPSPAQVTVTATSVADPTKSSSATVTVVPPVAVSVAPKAAQLVTGTHQQFTATVTGTSNLSVTWSLSGVGCSGTACGTITTAGLYTAPSTVPSPAQVTVTATSVADPTKSSSATVTVIPPVAVSVAPKTAQVVTLAHQQFTATVTGSSNLSVTWSLSGIGCSGTACGTITTAGLYTAPSAVPSPAQVTLTATSVADPTKSSSATVTVIPPVAVSVAPKAVQLVTGTHQQFTATVTGTSNLSVTWSLSGVGCSGTTCGTITTGGLYTAPSAVPSPAQVTVTATSVADPTKSNSATVTIVLPVSVTVTPPTAQVLTGAHQQFTATVIGIANTSVTWSLTGTGCSGATCGTITTAGLYTAPSTVPSPVKVTVTATSVGDPSKSGKSTVTVIPGAVSVAPKTAQVVTGGHQQFTATVTGSSNTSVTWSLSGTGCAGAACGTVSATGLYTAPNAIPASQVTVTATSVADPSKSGSATVIITGPVMVSISPKTVQLVTGTHQQFTATVTGSANTSVAWSVSGTGCSGAACGSVTSTGLYTAPAAIPNPAQAFVTATSLADPTKSATADVTVGPPVAVSVAPKTVTVVADATQQFTATVTGTSNTGVTWTVKGAGCSGAACGTITSGGLYTAPGTVPSPAQVTVTATSAIDSTKSAVATVTIIPAIVVRVSPATVQVLSGAHQQFTATVTGTSNTTVTWSLSGPGCSGVSCGIITPTGLYTAPGAIPSPAQVTVKATSLANAAKSGSAIVTIVPQIAVNISPQTAQVVTGSHLQFGATVTGTSNTGVTWSLSGSGCSGSTCGTISASGFYTAPQTIPSPAQVTVTATSKADNARSDSAAVTIILPVVVTISPTTAIVAVNGQQQFHATVAGASDTAVSWSVSGAGCSGAACGTLTSGGLFTAPASVPSPAIVVVKASSQVDPSQSASATVTILANENAKLDGEYAFMFTGFDNSGVYQAAGSFTANGNGTITSGHEDVNDTAGPAANISISGTYQIDGGNRGTLSLSSTLGTQQFKFVLNLLGTQGRFIAFDASGIRGSGVLERQDPAAFKDSALTGSYVLSLAGKDGAGARIGALGVILPNGKGTIAAGTIDVNDGGVVSSTLGLNGIYNVASSGRGTATLIIPGFAGGTLHFAFYVVSANKFFMVSTEQLSSDHPIFGGPVEKQTGTPFQTSVFHGPTIFNLAGETSNVSQVTVGQVNFDGSSQLLVEFDENTGGKITSGNVLTGAYDVQLNGRGTLNLDNSNGLSKVWYLYAIAPNRAFIMDASTADVGVGELSPQSPGPPFVNSDIVGTYLIGSGEPLISTATLYSGYSSFDGATNVHGLGSVSGSEDISRSSGLFANQKLSGTYRVSKSPNNGRAVLVLTAPNDATIALWIASPSEVVGVGIDSTNTQPVVLHFEQ